MKQKEKLVEEIIKLSRIRKQLKELSYTLALKQETLNKEVYNNSITLQNLDTIINEKILLLSK